MRTKFGYSRQLATFINGTFSISFAFSNVVIGKLSSKYKKRKIFYIIGSILLLPPIYIIYCDENANIYVIVLMNVIAGIGTGLKSIIFASVREYNDYYGCSDIASSIVNTIGVSSAFIMQWLIGILIDHNWSNRDGELDENNERIYVVKDYNEGFIVIPIMIGMNCFIAIFMRETNGKPLAYDNAKRCCTRYFC
eukprot:275543_1